jgi:HlyD family secretion protein
VLTIPIIALTVRDEAGKKFRIDDAESGPSAASDRNAGPRREVEGVFLMQDGKAQWVPVKIGITGDRYFEVTDGLKGGETVVSGTFQVIRDLEDGSAVRTAAAAKNGKSAGDATTSEE